MGANRIDLVRRDVLKRDQRWNNKRGGDEKYCLIRPEIADRAHSRCRQTIADRSEARVAAEPFAAGGMTDEPKADGGKRGAHDGAPGGLQKLRAEHGRKDGP